MFLPKMFTSVLTHIYNVISKVRGYPVGFTAVIKYDAIRIQMDSRSLTDIFPIITALGSNKNLTFTIGKHLQRLN